MQKNNQTKQQKKARNFSTLQNFKCHQVTSPTCSVHTYMYWWLYFHKGCLPDEDSSNIQDPEDHDLHFLA